MRLSGTSRGKKNERGGRWGLRPSKRKTFTVFFLTGGRRSHAKGTRRIRQTEAIRTYENNGTWKKERTRGAFLKKKWREDYEGKVDKGVSWVRIIRKGIKGKGGRCMAKVSFKRRVAMHVT